MQHISISNVWDAAEEKHRRGTLLLVCFKRRTYIYLQAVPDVKTNKEPSNSQRKDDSKHHYDVGDLHTWG